MPRKKPSTVAKLNTRIAELEAILAGTRAELVESEKISMAKILNATFEKFNAKHRLPMPIKPRPFVLVQIPVIAKSCMVRFRGSQPVIIEDYHEQRYDGKVELWGLHQSRMKFKEDEIEVIPVEQPARSIPELPRAPTEEDEVSEPILKETGDSWIPDSF